LKFIRGDGITSSASSETLSVILRSGQTVELKATYTPFIIFDIGDTNITEFIVTVTNISDIQNVSWRIPVYH
jgi:hypothetical protein